MIRLLPGDCRSVLPTLPDASVQCVVTSPPYYALRSYLHADDPDKAREMGSEPTPEAFINELVAALLVADRLGRDAVGIDLSHAYVEMARERLHADCPLFADISPPPAEDPEDERMADLFAMAAD